MTCVGCKERREKIIAKATEFIEWVKNPTGASPIGGVARPPKAPLIVRPAPPDPNKLKRN